MYMAMMCEGGGSERYVSGANSSDLTVRKDGRGDDIEAIVSVAWNRSRIGAALLRLHSEFDGAARRGLQLDQVFQQLKSLPDVRAAMLLWAKEQRKPEPGDLVAAVLAWWLDKTCKTCNGTQWVTRANRPKQPCTTCHGTGEARIPHGEAGRAQLAYMESCLYRARASIKGRAAR